MKWVNARDIKKNLKKLVVDLKMDRINLARIICFRSFGSKSKARARIWSFPRVWQQALNLPPYYIVEVLSEKYDKLSENDKKKVLIHELMHIPKNFSGSLIAHRSRYLKINSKTIEKLFSKIRNTLI